MVKRKHTVEDAKFRSMFDKAKRLRDEIEERTKALQIVLAEMEIYLDDTLEPQDEES